MEEETVADVAWNDVDSRVAQLYASARRFTLRFEEYCGDDDMDKYRAMNAELFRLVECANAWSEAEDRAYQATPEAASE